MASPIKQLERDSERTIRAAKKVLERDASKIRRRMKKLGDRKELNKVLRNATLAGARVIRDSARENAPVETGELKRKIIARTRRRRRNQGVLEQRASVTINPKSPARYYAHLVELGTSPHQQKRGVHPGAAARPFLRPAVDANRKRIVDAVRDRVDAELIKRGF